MSDRQKHIILGSFNAERFWRDQHYATLPFFKDNQANMIVEAMDEMQFVFAEQQDSVIITRFKMNNAHLRYLSELGFNFSNMGINEDLSTGQEINIKKDIIGQLKEKYKDLFKSFKYESVKLDSYAIVSDPRLSEDIFNTKVHFPNTGAVKKVNSKIFSTRISDTLKTGSGGYVVNSTASLQQYGQDMLKESPVLIKDPFGVSGSGNILIKRELALKSIVKHLYHQEQQGKLIQFIIEPYLDKLTDFSCQLMIEQSGNFKIISFHIMHNEKFRFSGIEQADESFIKKIQLSGYLVYIEKAAMYIAESGYFGPVCIDSMILSDDRLIPIVEINARKSMGLINHALCAFINKFDKNLRCRMVTLSFMVDYRLSFDHLLEQLDQDGLLFSKGKTKGILPLSANTVDINARLITDGPYKGRLYYHIIYTTIAELDALQENMYTFCNKLDLKKH
ncbi:hypothetical protein [Pedobacter sp. R20-19]|uniref:hypothetical protein n=1 Tax=Pedobacter sp. R20-19 TaxID=1270196 RepID=UPI00049316DF|nr:hypothetical protein [Pedobacter sp. R20-19]